jgi:hypothetical protein
MEKKKRRGITKAKFSCVKLIKHYDMKEYGLVDV